MSVMVDDGEGERVSTCVYQEDLREYPPPTTTTIEDGIVNR